MLISVIVPVYNVERYLRRCVFSFMGQTYGKIEIILVDDGSSDRRGAICDELTEEDGRIRKESGLIKMMHRSVHSGSGILEIKTPPIYIWTQSV